MNTEKLSKSYINPFCEKPLWHDIYFTYMGHSIGTCSFCGKKTAQIGVFDVTTICPYCGGKTILDG